MARRTSFSSAGTVATVLAALATPASADLLVVESGEFAVFDIDRRHATLAGLEYRMTGAAWLPWDLTALGPHIGTFRTTRDSAYTYAGLHLELDLGSGWRVTPQVSAGHYEHGARGMRLGAELEFRSGAEISYALSDRLRLHTGLYHLSNNDFGTGNPGAETFVFGLQWTPGLM